MEKERFSLYKHIQWNERFTNFKYIKCEKKIYPKVSILGGKERFISNEYINAF